MAGNVGVIVIVNPHQGSFREVSPKAFESSISSLLKETATVVPAYRCNPDTKMAQVKAFLTKYPEKQVALVYGGAKFSDDEIKEFVNNPKIKFHIALKGKLSQPQRALISKKKAVDIVENFSAEDRNADYGGSELFSEHHTSYKSTCIGFGDYSISGSKFKKGGGPAHAVAIHIMYHPPNSDELFIEHFISDDTDKEVGSVAGKYLQAVSKIEDAVSGRPSEFPKTGALKAFMKDAASNYFPGLGMSKRRQIMHHLESVHRWLYK